MNTGALYIRVSTHGKQEELSPAAQKRLLLDYAKKHDIVISKEHIFVENGISGRKADRRPEFQRMIAIAKSKDVPFDTILVWKYSRFARNQEESIVYKSMLKKKCGVDVVSVSEPLIDGPFGSLIERIIEWMDEYYSLNLSEEVMRGMTEKARRGQYQAAPPIGYIMKDRKLVIEPEESKIVHLIYDQYLAGSSPFAIAKLLNASGHKTKRGNKFENRGIIWILTNPTYTGYVSWNGITEKCDHEALIDQETFDKVQALYKSTHRQRHSRPPETQKHWLAGLLYCSSCGSRLASGGHRAGNYQCTSYSKGKCTESHHIMHSRIQTMVIDAFGELQKSDHIEFEIRKDKKGSIDTELLVSTLRTLDQKENRIKAAYMDGIDTIEEYRRNKEIITKERERITAELDRLKSAVEYPDPAVMRDRVCGVYDIISSDQYDHLQKHRAITSVCEKIIYDKCSESIDITLFNLIS